MERSALKIYRKGHSEVALKIVPGHFATSHSHINYYIDITTLKIRQSEAKAIAKQIANEYKNNTIVDTIVCMDGCDVIGAYLADELTYAGIMSMNSHKTIYIVNPEFNSNGQMIFRDNITPTIKDKHILLLLASATTGKTINRCIECINYYGGRITGISSIFTAINTINDIPIKSVFHANDIPDYKTYNFNDCPLCKQGKKIEAIVNGYGYSML